MNPRVLAQFCEGLRGFCDSFYKTLAAIFGLKFRALGDVCEGCEGFPPIRA